MDTMIEVSIRWIEQPMLEHRLAEGSLKGTHYAERQLIAVLAKTIRIEFSLRMALKIVVKIQI
jgi:hypothetical protein